MRQSGAKIDTRSMSTLRSAPSSLEIAQSAELRPIGSIAEELGLTPDEWEPYGHHKAKIGLSVLERLESAPGAPVVCVTAITPTAFGEGKTTTAVALTETLGMVGARPVLCLREPSLGPVFGIKGGAAGGGRAQVLPMEQLNLHFTGDLHAIGAANNLLAALLDAHVLHGNALGIDPLTITWRRCMDMNDRSLRRIVTGLGGKVNGLPRETGFDITAASEVMGIVAVALGLEDLRTRLGAITVARTYDDRPVTAEELGAAGAMTVLLKDALNPNLVQTLEGQPAIVHAGPFANIASGNNSIVADLVARKLGDVVVTESGFGADMGFEKFADVVCRAGGLEPDAVVLVATPKTMALHGPENIARHLSIVRAFGLDPVNKHPDDTRREAETARSMAFEAGATSAEVTSGFEHGGAGSGALAEAVLAALERPRTFRYAYEDEDPLEEKVRKIAVGLYGAAEVELLPAARARLTTFARDGLDLLPVVMAKTHLSVSHDAGLGATPSDYTFVVRDFQAYTGAGWIVALCGDMQTMPGLSAKPAAVAIDIGPDGRTVGLF
jgi:formate--tetrahydrofolate ligase